MLVLSSGRTISASRQALEQIQRGSPVLCAKLNYRQFRAPSEQCTVSEVPAVANLVRGTDDTAFVSITQAGIAAYE